MAGNVSKLLARDFFWIVDADPSFCADYIVYDVWLALELAVVYFLFIETGNGSLEETAALLDGVAVRDKLVEQVAHATTTDYVPEIVEKI